MRRLLLWLLWFVPGPVLAAGPVAVAPAVFDSQGRTVGAPLSERVVSYEIDARLEPSRDTLTGQETITWKNRSAEPQSTLWFHLYWNAFKNGRSTFYRDARAMGGFRDESVSNPSEYPKRDPDEWGSSDVKAIAVRGGADLLPTLRFEHPDDDNADDQTVFTVTLPQPVPPGGSVTLEVRWEARIPRVVARAGRSKTNDYFLMGQWFPKLGVLEVPPERGVTRPSWNCHQYHSNSEFYADFGTYDVRLTVPGKMKVGATGVLLGRQENADGTATLRYHQDDVIDFAWTASEKFEVIEDVFRSPGLPEVALTVLLEPVHHRSAAQILEATKSSLEHYGRWWYPFPYSHLTLVAPPTNADASAGMEYPTFITVDSRAEPVEPRDYLVWATVAHELGHNYWMGMVASNEFEESWLDEGINSYGTYKEMAAEGIPLDLSLVLPKPLRQLVGGLFALDWTEKDRLRALSNGRPSSPIVTASWKYRNQGDYSFNSYSRTQLTLAALEEYVGEDTMARIMRTYVERWKFRHPRSEDFFAVADEVSGQDLGWFWDVFFRGTGGLDYAVSKLSCSEAEPSAVKGEALQRCVVEVERVGGVGAPVEVKVTFEEGAPLTESWDGQGRWYSWTFDRPGQGGRIRQVEVGPPGLTLLDASPVNNARTRSFSSHVTAALTGWVTYAGQMLTTLTSIFI